MTTTTAQATARDALANRIENLFYIQESGVARMDWGDMADAMIAALRDAGYTIVYRNTDADDVEARARKEIAEYIEPYWDDQWDGADGVLDWLAAAGLRIVDAAQDDRRSEALWGNDGDTGGGVVMAVHCLELPPSEQLECVWAEIARLTEENALLVDCIEASEKYVRVDKRRADICRASEPILQRHREAAG